MYVLWVSEVYGIAFIDDPVWQRRARGQCSQKFSGFALFQFYGDSIRGLVAGILFSVRRCA